MSRSLSVLGIDHVVLERGQIGEHWHSQRWNSLHLLTTNASVLFRAAHSGDPDAFMPASAFAAYLQTYAQTMDVPVIRGVEVTKVEPAARGYRVSTNAGQWLARSVIIATGACDTPFVPAMASALTPSIAQILSPADYREPGQLPKGGVLVVGASSTGVQLAEEIHASGRPGGAGGRRSHARAAPLSRPRYLRLDGNGGHPRRSRPAKAAISQPLAASRRCNWWAGRTIAISTSKF